ncbi:MAG: hypothetical protein PHT12_01910 [Patescibacteria group bacterium]|nr:hypothetical protein [Patescibacteria group bacterium]
MNNHPCRHRSSGFSLISASLLTAVILVFGYLIANSALSSRQAAKSLETSVNATQIAEAGIQKAIFCLNATSGTKCGGTYGVNYLGESEAVFGNGKFTTTVVGSGADRFIVSTGYTGGGQSRVIRTDATTVPPADSTAFGYALQSGDGGAHLENNAVIEGTLYANGDVTCQSTQAKTEGDIWVAKSGGSITACRTYYHAHADKIFNSHIDGDAYYKNDPADIAGTTVDGTKYPNSDTPTTADMPSMDLEFWHNSAVAGGTIYGDYHPPDDPSCLNPIGPKKIEGNLILDNNIDVCLYGPLWVVGNITTYNNSSFSLDPSFGAGSTVILADDPSDMVNKGKITIVNGTDIHGSGNLLSHILIVSTNSSLSDTSPALSVANNASGAIFMALNGTMRLQSNGGAKSLAAKRLYLDQNAVVTYVESQLKDVRFSNSPGGTWRIKEGTWREAAN